MAKKQSHIKNKNSLALIGTILALIVFGILFLKDKIMYSPQEYILIQFVNGCKKGLELGYQNIKNEKNYDGRYVVTSNEQRKNYCNSISKQLKNNNEFIKDLKDAEYPKVFGCEIGILTTDYYVGYVKKKDDVLLECDSILNKL